MDMRFRESEARTHRRARANAAIIPLSLIANPLFFLPVGCAFAFAARRFRRNA